MSNDTKKPDTGVPLKRLVMMLARPWLYLLATPWVLWLAVKGGVIVEVDFSEIRYLAKSWFAVLARPAFWLGYANDAEYRKAKHHNEVGEWTAITPGEVEREEEMKVREWVERKTDGSRSLKRLVRPVLLG